MKNPCHPVITLLSAIILAIGCSKEEDPVEWHEEEFCHESFSENRFPLPPVERYDINHDGIDDFEIFQQANVISTDREDSRIYTFLNPLNANAILIGSTVVPTDSGVIFHISQSVSWVPRAIALMQVGGCNDLFERKWRIISYNDESPYHLFKLRSMGVTQLAWMKFDMNAQSGEVRLVDSDFSNDSSIVIGVH